MAHQSENPRIECNCVTLRLAQRSRNIIFVQRTPTAQLPQRQAPIMQTTPQQENQTLPHHAPLNEWLVTMSCNIAAATSLLTMVQNALAVSG